MTMNPSLRNTLFLLPLLALLLAAASPAGAADAPWLRSSKGLVLGLSDGRELYAKEADTPTPIASLTKLMTAMVILDAGLKLEEPVVVTSADRDRIRGSSSRLLPGTSVSRRVLLLLALMASENRAANALARTYPGGTPAFVAAMNRKAQGLGLNQTKFADPAGLDSGNVSTARELANLVRTAMDYPLIRQYTTTWEHEVAVGRGKSRQVIRFRNTNRLLRNESWDIALSKTGYISDSGRCLVMQARIAGEPVILVLLDSWGKLSPMGDANRVRKWMEKHHRDT
ncbi:D-alanyl-D-alanine endopeptidase (penicillin-binding protein 7) [Thioalbus denitrificans]|uniref:D-alanyl-D-alanine endopeptidase (Penicillin-binding protein 7) n=2 Tax=Thioalbus denitrificans TaxID=547122 RepID=A0A369CDE3_9GAMM|nr:D-alanyl-D-alanine endopeptidase (penicillin-binding protein 7) [Thioalbus denitrificans]